MYRPPDSDSDDDYDGFSFGDEIEKTTRTTASDIFQQELDIDNQLYKYVVEGDLDEIKETISYANYEINYPLRNGLTLLHHAAKYGHSHIVKFLLENGANSNRQVDSTTPLMEACNCTSNTQFAKEIVALLLKHGAVVNTSDKYGMTPLMFASVNGLADVVKLLLPTASLEASDNQGWTAIFHAIENNQQEVVQLLVNAGVEVNTANRKGYTPRQVAQFHGFYDILEILPKEEYQYFVPLTYLTYNSLRDSIPRLFLKSEIPEYFQEVNAALCDMQMERFVQYFALNSISFDEFLTITESKLEDIGIKYPYQRKKILLGVLNFYLNNWSKKSIARVKRKENDTFYDILMLAGNQLKHLVIINSSIKYVRQNLENKRFGDVNLQRIMELQETVKDYKYTLAELKKIARYLRSLSPERPPLFIDYEEYIAQNRRLVVKKYIKYSIFIGVTIVLCLKMKKFI